MWFMFAGQSSDEGLCSIWTTSTHSGSLRNTQLELFKLLYWNVKWDWIKVIFIVEVYFLVPRTQGNYKLLDNPNPKGTSLSRMRQLVFLLVFSLKFCFLTCRGPNKHLNNNNNSKLPWKSKVPLQKNGMAAIPNMQNLKAIKANECLPNIFFLFPIFTFANATYNLSWNSSEEHHQLRQFTFRLVSLS